MYCTRCGAQLSKGIVICPECGARQRRQSRSIRCAYCRGHVPVGLVTCPHCGRDLRPAGPRWGFWLAGAAMAVLAGLWGLGRLPVERVWWEINDTRARLAKLVQISELPTPAPVPAATRALPLAQASSTSTVTLPTVTRLTTPTMTSTMTMTVTEQPAEEPALSLSKGPLGAAPTTTPTTTVTPEVGSVYIVQNGDTLAAIGARLDIPWQIIAAANGINASTVLQVGQRLKLPTPTLQPTQVRLTPTVESSTAGATVSVQRSPLGRNPLGTPAVSPSLATAILSAPTATPTSPRPTATAAATSGPTTYRVQVGDTLEQIGQRFGVAWQAIAAANNITGSTVLRVGQQLIIPPPGAPVPPMPTPHPRPTATPTTPSPTPLPSFPAPVLENPGDQAPFWGDTAFIELTWQPVNGLPADAKYRVWVKWVEGGNPWTEHWDTPQIGIRVPPWLWGRADQPAREYTWWVEVVCITTDGKGGESVISLSPPNSFRTFSWN